MSIRAYLRNRRYRKALAEHRADLERGPLVWLSQPDVRWLVTREGKHKMEATKYRKKLAIEAMRYDGTNADQIVEWSGARFMSVRTAWRNPDNPNEYLREEVLAVKALEGDMVIRVGDYVIRGVEGEFYPCAPSIFEATYERVEAVRHDG